MHYGHVQKTLLVFLGVGLVTAMVQATIAASMALEFTWWSFLAPAVFALLCSLFLLERASLPVFRRGALATARQLLLAMAATGALALVAPGGVALSTRMAVVIFVGATAEELVFRVALPERVRAIWAGTGAPAPVHLGAALSSQAAFAACHLHSITRYPTESVVVDLSLLIACGLVYAACIELSGLWSAITLHASWNLRTLSAPWTLVPWSAQELTAACLVVGVLALITPFALARLKSARGKLSLTAFFQRIGT